MDRWQEEWIKNNHRPSAYPLGKQPSKWPGEHDGHSRRRNRRIGYPKIPAHSQLAPSSSDFHSKNIHSNRLNIGSTVGFIRFVVLQNRGNLVGNTDYF